MPTSPNWFPVFTLLLGYLAAAITEYFRDRRTRTREREDRREQRVEAIRQQKSEFQRATLLELQGVVARLGRMTGGSHHHDVMAFRRSGVWQRTNIPEEFNEGQRQAIMDMVVLSPRVANGKIRELANDFKNTSALVLHCVSEAEAKSLMDSAMLKFEALHEHIGHELREIDQTE